MTSTFLADETWFGFTAERPNVVVQTSLKPLPPVAAERYRIERLLGVGGMAAIYEVRDLLSEQYDQACPKLAMKMLSAQCADHPDAELLLYAEFALLRRLHHPHIVRAYTLERDRASGHLLLLLERLEGPTLAQWIIEHPAAAQAKQTSEIARQLIAVIKHCHAQGVVHGDLKPGNIILAAQGIKLLDFGLGHASEGSLPALCRQNFAAWTPPYVAPEVRAGGPTSIRSDIYALGCILTELYGGRLHHPAHPQTSAAPWSKKPDLPRKCLKAIREALICEAGQRSPDTSSLTAAFDQASHGWHLKRLFGGG